MPRTTPPAPFPDRCNTYTSSKTVPNDVQNVTTYPAPLPDQCKSYVSSEAVPNNVQNDVPGTPSRPMQHLHEF